MKSTTDILGQLLMENFRDVAIGGIEGLCEEKFDSPNHNKIQNEISHFSEHDR